MQIKQLLKGLLPQTRQTLYKHSMQETGQVLKKSIAIIETHMETQWWHKILSNTEITHKIIHVLNDLNIV